MKKSSLKDTISCINSIDVSCCVNKPVTIARTISEKAKIIVPDNAIANAFCITYFRFPFLLTQKNLKRFFFSNKYVFRYGATSITGANA